MEKYAKETLTAILKKNLRVWGQYTGKEGNRLKGKNKKRKRKKIAKMLNSVTKIIEKKEESEGKGQGNNPGGRKK
jgi:hypothetical protein